MNGNQPNRETCEVQFLYYYLDSFELQCFKVLSCNLLADEPLEITYSYWDGAGHRRVIQVRPCSTLFLWHFHVCLFLARALMSTLSRLVLNA